jgi:hypothetical protein
MIVQQEVELGHRASDRAVLATRILRGIDQNETMVRVTVPIGAVTAAAGRA